MSSCINQLVLLHVNQLSESSEKVRAKNGLLYLSNNEYSWDGSMKSQVKGERSPSVHTNRSVVHCHKCEFVWWVPAIRGKWEYCTHFRPCVHQKTCPCVRIMYVEEVTWDLGWQHLSPLVSGLGVFPATRALAFLGGFTKFGKVPAEGVLLWII